MTNDALEYLAQAPLAIAPRYLGYMVSVLQGRADAIPTRTPVVRGQFLDGTMVLDGIAVVPIVGPIVQRADLFGSFGAVSVGSIRATVGAALEDPAIDGLLLVVDSPGGEVAGVADLADALFAARGRKPMLAVADEGMFSAAYWLGSAVGPVVLPRTGSVGSIGALVVHADMSSALDKLGVKMNIIRSGAKKAQFSPFQPLSDEARATLQAEVNRVAGFFFEAVSRQRGLSTDAIEGFQAGTFEGEAAVRAGLADRVDTVDGAFLALKMQLLSGAPTPSSIGARRERTAPMAEDHREPPVAAPEPVTQPAIAASVPKAPAATPWTGATNVVSIEAARKQARDEAAAAERKRAADIMHWCAFAGKADMAESYMESPMTIEQVRDDLLQQTAGAGFEIQTQRGVTSFAGAPGRRLDTIDEIYARRRAAVAESVKNRRYF